MIRRTLANLWKSAIVLDASRRTRAASSTCRRAAETCPIGSALESASALESPKATGISQELCAGLAFWPTPPRPGRQTFRWALCTTRSFILPLIRLRVVSYVNSLRVATAVASGSTGPFHLTFFRPRINPGPPLSGSSVTLTNTASTVSLDSAPGSPVSSPTDTNFFLFVFDFNRQNSSTFRYRRRRIWRRGPALISHRLVSSVTQSPFRTSAVAAITGPLESR